MPPTTGNHQNADPPPPVERRNGTLRRWIPGVFPQVGFGDGCGLLREGYVWKPNGHRGRARTAVPAAGCEMWVWKFAGRGGHYVMPQRNGCAKALDLAVRPDLQTQMDHILAGLQSAEADNDNRRAWDRWAVDARHLRPAEGIRRPRRHDLEVGRRDGYEIGTRSSTHNGDG